MITSHPNTTMAKKGHTKELNCTARGEWPIIIRWERGDTVIDPDRNPRYSITTSPNEKTDEVLSTLKVGVTIRILVFMMQNLQREFWRGKKSGTNSGQLTHHMLPLVGPD